MRRWFLLAVILLLVVEDPQRVDARRSSKPTPGAVAPTPAVDKNSADRLRRAIERAAGYLGSREQGGAGAWMATRGAMLLGRNFEAWARTLKVLPGVLKAAPPGSDSPIPEILDERLWALRWLPERPAVRLSKPEAAPVDRTEARRFENQDAANYLGILLVAVSCRTLAPELQAKWAEMLSTPARSYLLTQQLLGLMLSYDQGCLQADVTDPIRLRLATQLYEQTVADGDIFDALTIERLSILCYARVCDWIDPELIARLTAEQQPSGSWGVRDPHVYPGFRASEEHTAARAFYVLARSWILRDPPGPGPKPPPAPANPKPPKKK